jgi:ATP-dependent protease ClpP protease subunit
MLHVPATAALGSSTRLRQEADALDALNSKCVALLSKRTGQPLKVCDGWLSGPDRWFTAQEAVANGLVDEIGV